MCEVKAVSTSKKFLGHVGKSSLEVCYGGIAPKYRQFLGVSFLTGINKYIVDHAPRRRW